MKIIGLLLLGTLSFLWGYFSWQYLNVEPTNSLALMILLAWMFVFGVLFGKIHLFENKKVVEYRERKLTTLEKELFTEGVEEEIKVDQNIPVIEKVNNYIPEIEPIVEEKKTHAPHTQNNINNFSDFENVPDNSFLNISNNLKKQKKQDLKVVEWIGPKIESILNEWKIYSYQDLENSSVRSIKKLLEEAWSRYSMHNPNSWWKQASYAWKWDIEGLKKYQDTLIKWVEQS